ncbi:MAG: hypothetical protein RhofKO_40740 [Rhodothermales bacterium]
MEHGAHVFESAEAAAHGEWNENLVGGAADHIVHDAALFMGGGDVEEDEFVGPGSVVETGLLNGVTGIDDVHKTDTFYDAPLVNVKAGNDAFCEHAG